MSENKEQDDLKDLKERLFKASNELRLLAETAPTSRECARLLDKRDGVRLALSYVEEYL